jgi:zinc/manganese transport system ATP-binding protein
MSAFDDKRQRAGGLRRLIDHVRAIGATLACLGLRNLAAAPASADNPPRPLGASDGLTRPHPMRQDGGRASVTLRNVTLGYANIVAVEALTGVFAPGSLTAVVGANGAGKSTLLRAIAGLIPCRKGTIEIAGAEPVADLAYMPQSDAIDRDFPISVLEFAALGHWGRFGAFGGVAAALLPEVMEALRVVGLGELAGRAIGELSGGQFRRALFARIVVQDASIVVLDEPFAGIDAATTGDLLALVRRWHVEGRTVMAAVQRFLDRIIDHCVRQPPRKIASQPNGHLRQEATIG